MQCEKTQALVPVLLHAWEQRVVAEQDHGLKEKRMWLLIGMQVGVQTQGPMQQEEQGRGLDV